jgi:gliding motility-associated-like protein
LLTEKWFSNFDNSYFIENKGQRANEDGRTLSFYCQLGGTEVSFFNGGISFTTLVKQNVEENSESNNYPFPEKEKEVKTEKLSLELLFRNVNDHAYYEGFSPLTHYTTSYLSDSKKSLKAANFSEVIYKDVWDNIDIQFYLPEEGGLKFNFIIHPGADPTDISWTCPKSEIRLLKDGSLEYISEAGIFKDATPTAYIEGSNLEIPVKTVLKKELISFNLGEYDNKKTIIIDPWITTPIAEADNIGFRVDYDNEGNVFVLGGDSYIDFFGAPINIIGAKICKYDPFGALLWTWEAPSTNFSHLGDMSCRRETGEVYWTRGTNISTDDVKVASISADGVLVNDFYPIDDDDVPFELWRCMFDNCNEQLIIGTGNIGLSGPQQCVNFSADLGTIIYENVLGLPGDEFCDVVMLDIDPDGSSAYFTVATNAMYPENSLFKVSLPDFSTLFYTIDSGLSFEEIGTVTYSDYANGYNGMAVDLAFLYTYDGKMLEQRDKATGAVINSTDLGLTPYVHAGIDTDICGNIYVGTDESILVFNPDLEEIESYAIPDTCYDIRVSATKIYATGKDFVTEISLPGSLVLSQTPTCEDECNGTATLNLECIELTDDYEIVWFPSGQITPTATELCSGEHTVSLIIGCDTLFTTSIFVEDSTCGLNITLPNDTICEGDCIDLIAEVTSGTEPYTFEWSPGIIETGDSVNVCPVVTTTYEVIVIDALGETDTTSATITVLSPPIIDLGSDTILCEGESLTLDAENPGSTYLWQDGSADQTFSVTTAGIYWVEINNSGCSSTDSITVTFIGPEVDLGPDTTICLVEDFVLDAGNPGMDYLWQDGSTDQTFEVTDLGTYFVTVSTAGSSCAVNDTIVVSPGSIMVDLGNDTVLCATESLLLDAENPGATYLWSDSSTDQTLSVSTAGIYTVEVEDGICTGSDSIVVTFQSPVVEFTADDFEGCAPEAIGFTDLSTPSGEIASWSWDFDDGGISSLQNPSHLFTISGTYNVTLELTTTKGCTSMDNRDIEIYIYPTPEAAFTIDPDNPTLNDLVIFTDQSINAEAWFWDFGDGETSTNQNPTHNYSERGTFDVTLIVNNEICYDTTRYTIIIEEPIIFYVPNVFTPDGDNFNQIFQPIFTSGYDPYDFHLTIFNRWGELVFESYDASKGWNGMYGNKGIVQDGVYVWEIEFGDANSDKKYRYTGHVTLLK